MAVLAFDVPGDRIDRIERIDQIERIRAVLNPDKLRSRVAR
ncbi:hypothetical protein ABZ464_49295 [Streptomyces sp. NPDC005820]